MKIVINDQMLHQFTISAGVLTIQILKVLSVALNIYQKVYYVRSVICIFIEYKHLKRFI